MKKLVIALMIALSPLLALAKVVGKSSGPSGSVLLMDEPCKEGGKQLIVIDLQAKKLGDGCWVKVDDILYLISEKLGKAVIPADAFEWVENETTRPSGT